MKSKRQQIKEIDRIAQRYIILSSGSGKTAKNLLNWWHDAKSPAKKRMEIKSK